MSVLPEHEPLTIPLLISAKGHERISMLTAYDAPTAALLDSAGVDILLVGDSVEMTMYGEPNTLSATMDSMVHHARAVSRAAKRAVVVGDMPFLSYQVEPARAVENAGRFLAQGGCAAVKVEGGRRILPAVEAILAADIPVMGHVGPDAAVLSQARRLQGPGARGRLGEARSSTTRRRWPSAGCFAVVLECVPESLAAEITREIPIPTLGIGAGAACDGQVLVFHDIVGLTQGLRPRFVRRYVDLAPLIEEAARAFTRDVKSGAFPSHAESFAGGKPTTLRRCIEHGSQPLGRCANASARRAGPAARLPSSRRWARSTRGTCRSCAWLERTRAFTVVSIFVNPLQFSPGEDFSRYPRREEDDARLLEAEGVDLLYLPEAASFYPPDFSTAVVVGVVSEGGEGARRPGHFRGVATVVAKLLLQVQPDLAVFGRKDLQQAAVIRRMVRDLDFPVRLTIAETVREPDGLALSSRNAYLSPEERRRAPDLSRSLLAARARATHGEADATRLEEDTRLQLEAAGFTVDYVEAVDTDTMAPGRPRWRRESRWPRPSASGRRA